MNPKLMEDGAHTLVVPLVLGQDSEQGTLIIFQQWIPDILTFFFLEK